MPIIETSPYTKPYLVYDAPVNEKAQKIREMFKVGENGYPEHYQWRSLAKLGPKYSYNEPFEKFDPSDPKEFISQKVTCVGLATLLAGFAQWGFASYEKRPWWTKLHHGVILAASGSALLLWGQKKTHERQSRKFGIVMDYARKHPERFGEIKRPKMREVLLFYQPVR